MSDIFEISGIIKALVYTDEASGYCVLKIVGDDELEYTVTGTLPGARVAMTLSAQVSEVIHPKHGRQFEAESHELFLPETVDDIFSFLAAGSIPGIAEKTAKLIVDSFGAESLQVIETAPGKLAEKIKGLGLKRAENISKNFNRQCELLSLTSFLSSFKISSVFAMPLFFSYGSSAVEKVCDNPYILSMPHIGASFSSADSLALSLGLSYESSERVAAAVIYELRHNADFGHCFIPRDKLVSATSIFIDVPEQKVEEAIDFLISRKEIYLSEINGLLVCYLQKIFFAEIELSERLGEMLSKSNEEKRFDGAVIERFCEDNGVRFSAEQKEAIELASEKNILLIGGGPGTGKTFLIGVIIELYKSLGKKTLIAAPTGRAAKRISELTGNEAFTIHRMLGASFAEGAQETVFEKDEDDPLDTDLLILDECSMLDVELLNSCLKALPHSASLILVGDSNQLPSIGPGSVFADLEKNESLPKVILREIFRQSEQSNMVRVAHRILKKEKPELFYRDGDFFFLKAYEPETLYPLILDLIQRRLPVNMGISPDEIQVLSPTKKGPVGTLYLNRLLQETLNPKSPDKKEKIFGSNVFRVGDRVMQSRNNYDILYRQDSYLGAGIYNGDIGYILDIDPISETLSIDFEGKVAEYDYLQLSDLTHAWAISVHKAQGSEYKACILALLQVPKPLMSQSIFYTAISRAKELMIVVGDENAAFAMIASDKKSKRFSGLRARLSSEVVDYL